MHGCIKRWKIVILCIGIAVVLFLTAKYKQYDDYWGKAGKSYEDMLRLKGEPDFIENDRRNCIVHYKDIEYYYWSINAKRPFLIEIKDKDVRFTPFRIGIIYDFDQEDKVERMCISSWDFGP